MDEPMSRRRRGAEFTRTGTPGVYRRRNGRYVVFWYGRDGKRRSRTFAELGDACVFKAGVDRDRGRGTLTDPTTLTLSEYFERWLATYAGRTSRGIGPHTLREYRRDLALIVEMVGDRRLTSLTRRDVRLLVADLLDGADRKPPRRRAARTVAKTIAPLKAALADALEDELIDRNPAEAIRVRDRRGDGAAEPKARALSDEDLVALIAAAPEEHRLMVRFIAETGVRIGEAIAVRWGDLDLAPGAAELHVRRAIRDGTVKATKSAHGMRVIPLADPLARDLELAQMTSLYPSDESYVFPSLLGNPHSPAYLTRAVLHQAAAASGIDMKGAWHVLRHTAITRWLAAGMPPKTAQELAGHHSPEFTLRVYAEVRSQDAAQARRWVRPLGVNR
jgi:integrase